MTFILVSIVDHGLAKVPIAGLSLYISLYLIILEGKNFVSGVPSFFITLNQV